MFDDGRKPVSKAPYLFSEGHSQEHLNEQRTRYDEYIAHVDAEFGRMYDSLRKNGLLRNSYIILTSDHGELFERGVLGHVTALLYEPPIHIPLLIASPDQEVRKDVHTPTSCVDLLPTLLHMTGESIPDWCEGEVLPELGGECDEERSVFSVEAKLNSIDRSLTQGTIALMRGAYKLIHYFGYQGCNSRYELYDLKSDPEELENLCYSSNPVAADMENQLQQKVHQVNQPYG